MYNKNHKEELHRLVDSKSPLIFIRHFDFKMIDSMIDAIASENRANVYEYHQALGSIDFKTKSRMSIRTLARILLILAQVLNLS